MIRRRRIFDDGDTWCWECGKECALTEDQDEHGPFYVTLCCGSLNYADAAPWCRDCGNHTVAAEQRTDTGERQCLACAWTPDGIR